MHSRRARPTLRLLREDLTTDWESPSPQRSIAEDAVRDLHPVSELPHPIVRKAVDSFGADAASDNFVGTIGSATDVRLLEIKQSQWRGGVWEDPDTGVCWLVVAGLAKGNHRDHDDFYQRIERQSSLGRLNDWLPTSVDQRLLKQETAARIRTEWELEIQREVWGTLAAVLSGGEKGFTVAHPLPGQGDLASVSIAVSEVRDATYECDDIVVEIAPRKKFVGSNLLWQLTTRVLISIDPPEQRWDRFGNAYSNMGEVGAWRSRVEVLEKIVEMNDLATSEPGATSHYAHREHLAGKTINGDSVRALCGVYFVPTQDHAKLSVCTSCEELHAGLPA